MSMIVLSNTICAILYVFLFHIYAGVYMYVCVCICMYIYVCVCICMCGCVCTDTYVYFLKREGRGGQLCLNTSSRVDRDTRRPFSLAKQRMLHVILIAD